MDHQDAQVPAEETEIAIETEPAEGSETDPSPEAQPSPEAPIEDDLYAFHEPAAVGVSFRRSGKVYYFAPSGLHLRQGDMVLAQTEKGVDIGEVVFVRYDRGPDDEGRQLKLLLRKATPEDLSHEHDLQLREREARRVCEQKVNEHRLPMRLIAADYTFDGSRLTFFFSADGRVDFRGLVKDLAEIFRTRIELRQIGVRDQAKMIGGLGPCGRPLCCNAWLRNFDPVGIRVAKDQGLSLNPAKISGICDRLMCCLRYEHATYTELARKMPKPGQIVGTAKGPAVVKSVLLMHERVTVEYPGGQRVDLKGAQVWPADAEPPELPEEEAPERAEPEASEPLVLTTADRLTTEAEEGGEGRTGRRRRRRRPAKGGKGEAPAAPEAGAPPEPAAPRKQSRTRQRPAPAETAEAREPAEAPAEAAKPGGEATRRKRRRPRYRSRPKGGKPGGEGGQPAGGE